MKKSVLAIVFCFVIFTPWQFVKAQLKDGAVDTAFNFGYDSRYSYWNLTPGTGAISNNQNQNIQRLCLAPDGSLFAAGYFYRFNGNAVNGVVKLFPNGCLDTTFTAKGFTGYPLKVFAQADGKVLISGSLETDPVSNKYNVIRLLKNGSVDTAFKSCALSNGTVRKIVNVFAQ